MFEPDQILDWLRGPMVAVATPWSRVPVLAKSWASPGTG